jgi:hypothetical protein
MEASKAALPCAEYDLIDKTVTSETAAFMTAFTFPTLSAEVILRRLNENWLVGKSCQLPCRTFGIGELPTGEKTYRAVNKKTPGAQ